jgi:hypothetical protein
MPIKLSTAEHSKSHHFSLLPFNLLLSNSLLLLHHSHFFCKMVGEADQILHVACEGVDDNAKTASWVESDIPVASSSSNTAIKKMVNKDTRVLSDY